jgi:hypothetical protein
MVCSYGRDCDLCGHYLDVFNMIMPATVVDRWFIGIPELGLSYYLVAYFY